MSRSRFRTGLAKTEVFQNAEFREREIAKTRGTSFRRRRFVGWERLLCAARCRSMNSIGRHGICCGKRRGVRNPTSLKIREKRGTRRNWRMLRQVRRWRECKERLVHSEIIWIRAGGEEGEFPKASLIAQECGGPSTSPNLSQAKDCAALRMTEQQENCSRHLPTSGG